MGSLEDGKYSFVGVEIDVWISECAEEALGLIDWKYSTIWRMEFRLTELSFIIGDSY